MSKFHTLLDDVEIPSYAGRKIALCSKEGKPLRVQFPRMYMPFGLSGFTPEVGPTKWSIDFAMKGYDEDGNFVKKFYEIMKAFEEKIIDAVFEQSQEIFQMQKSKEELRAMFNSNIKESSDREPKFRVKVDSNMENNVRASVFDSDRNSKQDECRHGLYSRNSGTAIVEINSVYFLNKMFGVTYKLNQLIVYEPQTLKGFNFVV